MQIAKWGNSLAVRLPARMVQELGLKAGDEIQITAVDGAHFQVHRRPDPEEILTRLRAFRGSACKIDPYLGVIGVHVWMPPSMQGLSDLLSM